MRYKCKNIRLRDTKGKGMKKQNQQPKEYNDFFDKEENVFARLRKSTATNEHDYLKQKELAKAFKTECGIELTQKQISDLEHDNFKEIPKYMLDAYRQFFNVSTDYLLGFTDMRTVNLEMQRVSFVTGLSEKSLIVLDYLRKFKGVTNTPTGLINYSTIQCLNMILESYYDETIVARDNYCDNTKRMMEICYVDTLFSKIDDYINSSDAKCSLDNKKVSFTRKNTTRSIDIELMYEMMLKERVNREIEKFKKEGDAND